MNGWHVRQVLFRSDGFSLVEILVGLAMGILAVIIVMQVYAVNESTKRTTTGGADATTNGAIALYQIQRESDMAGWGLDSSLYLGRTGPGNMVLAGCATLNHYCSGAANCASADWSLAPLTITNGAGGGPDTITIRYFANPDDGNFVPSTTGAVYSNALDASSIPQLKVTSNFGCKKGDLVLVGDPSGTTCTLIQVSDTPGTTSGNYTLPHKSDSTATTSAYNNPAWDAPSGNPPAINTGVTLATCFTPAPTSLAYERTYSIDSTKGLLLRSDSVAGTVGEPVADGIVDLQAQYGIAADGTKTVTGWVDAAAGNWDNPVPKAGAAGSTTTNRLQNIKAIRVALLARSGQYEKPTTGTTCDATTGSPGTPGTNGWSSWATFATANYPADWKCYRYREFEIVIPLRNALWGNP